MKLKEIWCWTIRSIFHSLRKDEECCGSLPHGSWYFFIIVKNFKRIWKYQIPMQCPVRTAYMELPTDFFSDRNLPQFCDFICTGSCYIQYLESGVTKSPYPDEENAAPSKIMKSKGCGSIESRANVISLQAFTRCQASLIAMIDGGIEWTENCFFKGEYVNVRGNPPMSPDGLHLKPMQKIVSA